MGNCCGKDKQDTPRNATIHKICAGIDPADLKQVRERQIAAKKVGHAQVEHANACNNVWILAAAKFNAQNNQHLGKNFYARNELIGRIRSQAQGNK